MVLTVLAALYEKDAENYGEEDVLIKQARCKKNLETTRKISCVGGKMALGESSLPCVFDSISAFERWPPTPPKTASLAGPK